MYKYTKLRYVVDIFIGMLIYKLFFLKKYKSYLFSYWITQKKLKGIDRFFFRVLLLYWFRFEYLLEKNPDKRESLKGLLMGGKSGAMWAEEYDSFPLDFKSKVGRLTYEEACPLLPELDKILSSTKESSVVVQAGSSSGREIAWLAKRHPAHTYIGTDIYQEVIGFAHNRHNLPNLKFIMCSAKEIYGLLNKYRKQRIIVFSSGSLQYVQPEHLEFFFKGISRIPGCEIALLEPADESKHVPDRLKGSLWRGAFSYTHDYRFYAENSSLATKTCRMIRPYAPSEKFLVHKNVIHYFYWAKTERFSHND